MFAVLREIAILLFFILNYSYALPGKTCKIPNAGGGTCTVLSKCDPLFELNKKRPQTPEEEAFFRQSVASCGSRGSKLKVCCPPASQWEKLSMRPVVYPEPPISMTHSNEVFQPVRNDFDNRINDPLRPPLTLNVPVNVQEKPQTWFVQFNTSRENEDTSEDITESCGVDSNSAQRIVGGNATEIDEYPWLALLEYEPNNFKCGGSLISRSHVLTAAHCLYTDPSFVRLSEYNLTTEPTDVVEVNGGGTDKITVMIVEVAWTEKHPEHKTQRSVNDIGIVKMKKEVEYGDFIKPICLPTMDYKNTFFTIGTRFTVAGWGSDTEIERSEVKRSVFVPYVTMDVCMETNPSVSTQQVICAGGEAGKDSCRGDSGGPLMYEDSKESNYILVGIVSSGPLKCGTKDRPALYTYVYNYIDWINKVTRK